jgi:hypothetical protein
LVVAGCALRAAQLHGVTMQEGPDGNTPTMPTYWFWHPWACAGNKTGCPWVGHANASRIFDSYITTVGHGGVLNMNIAPDATGRMNASVVEVMQTVGRALNDTFRDPNAKGLRGHSGPVSGPCKAGLVVLNVTGSDGFDYIQTMEDLRLGQRIGNYSIDYRLHGSADWHVLVPPVQPANKTAVAARSAGFGDRPDGHDPRDQYIGHKRIDTTDGMVGISSTRDVAQVRFNCLRLIPDQEDNGNYRRLDEDGDGAGDPTMPPSAPGFVNVRQMSLHRRVVPW